MKLASIAKVEATSTDERCEHGHVVEHVHVAMLTTRGVVFDTHHRGRGCERCEERADAAMEAKAARAGFVATIRAGFRALAVRAYLRALRGAPVRW
jgi:hypothetical protein